METSARFALYLLAAVPLFAQVASEKKPLEVPAVALNTNPDIAWQQLKAMEAPIASQASQSRKSTRADLKAERHARGARLVEVSRLANAFYQGHPDHKNAIAARALEVTALIDAVQAGEVSEEPKALRLGMTFRNDKQLPEAQRFQVAARMMHLAVAKKNPRTDAERLAEYENQADNLLAEFPQNREVYAIFLGVVRNAPEAVARRAARKLILGPAPEDLKEQAQSVIDRYDMVGKRVDLEFATATGSNFDLASHKGNIVVVYTWSARTPAYKSAFRVAAAAAEKGHLVVGVCVDTDPKAANELVSRENPPGVQYADARGLASPVAVRLRILDDPCIYVFDANGTLAGFGPTAMLGELLNRASSK
jgi:hypothetical protein